MFALIDCSNFFVSCERVFEPYLDGKPVVVLSHNDSRVISRSDEAKALGIKIAQPFLQIQDLLSEHRVRTFLPNFDLYTDFSNRLMSILSKSAHKSEIYSIGEAFLEVEEMNSARRILFGQELRAKIKQWIGIPASIGFAPTKTLAKLAAHLAKETASGVYDLPDEPRLDRLLAALSPRDIWGIDDLSILKLKRQGVYTALDLKRMPAARGRKTMDVFGARVIYELNGISCLCLEDIPVPIQDTARKNFTVPWAFNPVKKIAVSRLYIQGQKVERSLGPNSFIQSLDAMNQRRGMRLIYFGAAGPAPFLKPKAVWKSPSYTTRWDSIKQVV